MLRWREKFAAASPRRRRATSQKIAVDGPTRKKIEFFNKAVTLFITEKNRVFEPRPPLYIQLTIQFLTANWWGKSPMGKAIPALA